MSWKGQRLRDLAGVDLGAAIAESQAEFYAAWSDPSQTSRLTHLFRAVVAIKAERGRREAAAGGEVPLARES